MDNYYLSEWFWEESNVVVGYIGFDDEYDDFMLDDDYYTDDFDYVDSDFFPRPRRVHVVSPVLTISEIGSECSREVDESDLFIVFIKSSQSDDTHPIEVEIDGTVGDLKRAIKRHRNPTIPFSTRLHNLIHSDSDEVLDDDDVALSDTQISGEDILVISYKPSVAAYVQLRDSGVECRYTALNKCIADKDIETLKLIHQSGIDVSKEPNTFSQAICNKNKEASLYLLEAGADPNRTLSDSFNHNISFLVDMLKEANALDRIQKLDFRQYSILCPTVKRVFQERGIEDLILPDLNPDVLGAFCVEDENEVELVKRLLTRSPEAVHVKDSKKRNALLHLLSRGEEVPHEILDIALQGEAYNQIDYKGRNCLHIACSTTNWMGHHSNIQYLLRKPELQPLLTQEDDTNKLPFSLCLKNRITNSDTCSLVLAKTLEAMPTISKDVLASFIKTAASVNKFKFCVQLIDRGAPSGLCDSDGRNLLHLLSACTIAHSELGIDEILVEELLQRGVDPNVYDNLGETPLSLSLERKKYAISDTLLEVTDLGILRANAALLIDRASRKGHFSVVAELVHRGLFVPEDNKLVLKQCLESRRDLPDNVLKLLIDHKCDINADVNPPLAVALLHCAQKSTIEIMLSHPDIDLRWVNQRDQGYLHLALHRQDQPTSTIERLEALINAGVPLGVGENPILYAITRIKSKPRIMEQQMMRLIKATDFNPKWRDHMGRNYLHYLIEAFVTQHWPFRIFLKAGVDPTAPDLHKVDAIEATKKLAARSRPNRAWLHITSMLENKQAKGGKGGKGAKTHVHPVGKDGGRDGGKSRKGYKDSKGKGYKGNGKGQKGKKGNGKKGKQHGNSITPQ
eukprot:TRINITY_DN1632_c4_g1_i1.p1 TRINITY_DN1632_c4_g1~~TRINITY_DN1632_c4_g1_i1.p1  ORF type:complete len:853 (+),score=111.79 TRINITY_DN1632_c4_g1_i1:107-2665(+)